MGGDFFFCLLCSYDICKVSSRNDGVDRIGINMSRIKDDMVDFVLRVLCKTRYRRPLVSNLNTLKKCQSRGN